MTGDETTSYPIPEKFRASLDISDEAAHALLLANDAAQKELGTRVNSPFTRTSPLDSMRSKAFVTIETLLKVKITQTLTADQQEQLAEAYATTGRYDLAYEATKVNKKLYRKYWTAIFAPDLSWCKHEAEHQYTKENIFSLKHGKVMPLFACNLCDFWQVADEPKHLTTARAKRAEARSIVPKGQTIGQLRAFHHSHVKR